MLTHRMARCKSQLLVLPLIITFFNEIAMVAELRLPSTHQQDNQQRLAAVEGGREREPRRRRSSATPRRTAAASISQIAGRRFRGGWGFDRMPLRHVSLSSSAVSPPPAEAADCCAEVPLACAPAVSFLLEVNDVLSNDTDFPGYCEDKDDAQGQVIAHI